MAKNNFSKYFLIGILIFLSLLFVAKFGGPNILKWYIASGMGDCRQEPILCNSPDEVIHARIDREYAKELLPREFPRMSISAPKGFDLVQETKKKVYYKRHKSLDTGSTIYLLYEPPGFFPGLYPQLKKRGVADNYEFIKRVMSTEFNNINNLTDAFFVIMKGIFLPNLGDQNTARMAAFYLGDFKGFINYNTVGQSHYFDCNIVDKGGDFFKVYIHDNRGSLGLDQVFTIISTVRKNLSFKPQP